MKKITWKAWKNIHDVNNSDKGTEQSNCECTATAVIFDLMKWPYELLHNDAIITLTYNFLM